MSVVGQRTREQNDIGSVNLSLSSFHHYFLT